MRAFLVCMCDIFLILYLTAITNVKPVGDLTVEDFYRLKSMHETLQADKKKEEAEFQDKLRRAQEEQEALLAEKQKQEELARREREEKEKLLAQKQEQAELAAARLGDLAGEKEELAARLAEERSRIEQMEQSLLSSDAERERINKDLLAKEERLVELNTQIAGQEEARRRMESSYQEELAAQKETIEEGRAAAEQLQGKVREAQLRAEATRARALREKEAKEEAQRKAAQELAARQKAETEKEKAIEVMETEQANRIKAEQNARILAATVEEIKQDGETAFENNIRPFLQKVDVAYERTIADGVTHYKRELSVLPVKVGEEIYAVFPSRQIGFSPGRGKPPDALVITYQGQRITGGRINKDEDLIAVVLPGYEGKGSPSYPAGTPLKEIMPTLLALRNNGSVSLLDKVRGIADDYFIVNRDYLDPEEDRGFKYAVRGFPGTGTRAERIIAGDQLVDLNGELIGVANRTNRVVPVNTVRDWVEVAF